MNGSTLSRANAVSYTSPTVGGFSVQAAWGENDVWDAALRYAGEFSGFRVAAGVGYINNASGLNEVVPEFTAGVDGPAQWKGSASILHVGTGLFVNGAYINQDNGTHATANASHGHGYPHARHGLPTLRFTGRWVRTSLSANVARPT